MNVSKGLIFKAKVILVFFFQDVDTNESRIRCTLLFTILKKLNRLAHMRCKKSRERTQEVMNISVETCCDK